MAATTFKFIIPDDLLVKKPTSPFIAEITYELIGKDAVVYEVAVSPSLFPLLKDGQGHKIYRAFDIAADLDAMSKKSQKTQGHVTA